RALQASTSKAQCYQVYGGVLGVSGVFKVHQFSMTALINAPIASTELSQVRQGGQALSS
ncbi:hypothetical protein WJX72_005399, partial [[Myrmecia] bisecta]